MIPELQEAITAHQDGRLEKAEQLYRSILKTTPAQLDAMALLGLVLGTQGQHDEALRLTAEAVRGDPQSSLFRFHYGNVLMNAGRLKEAVAEFRSTLHLNPTLAQASYNLANTLRALDDWTGAIEAYRKAIDLQPTYADAYNNLALSLVHEQHFDEALANARKSVEIDPSFGEGWRTLCNIAEQTGDYTLAYEAGLQCTKLMPDSHYSWFGLGVALCRLERYEEAIDVYKRALELKPERADIWDNLGQTYQSLNRLEDAEITFRKTIEVAGQTVPDEEDRPVDEREYGNRHWHLALLELLRGKYKEGFKRYRARFEDVGSLKRPSYSRPLWKGEPLQGKTILITDEQGFGDTLMLTRYLPFIKKQNARIILSVHKVLKAFYEEWDVIDEVITHGTSIGAYDCYASVFDLPYIFGTTLSTIPNEVPYLPRPQPRESVQLPTTEGRWRVGVVWGGNPLHRNDRKRSVPLPIFADLFEESGAAFFSLNRDMREGDEERLPSYPLVDCRQMIGDFADAARLIDQLDLVITCDTATAHLAGGLAKPVWILLPFAPDWRWLTDRSDSPWYPTARLFRQPRIGDWKSTIAETRRALRDILSSKPS